MADNINMAIDDDLMAQASGGVTMNLPYGYICEATVTDGPENTGTTGKAYGVVADNGERYLGGWAYGEALKTGDRVQLIHVENGFTLEPIMD